MSKIIVNKLINKDLILNNFKQLIKQIKIDIDNTTSKEKIKNIYRLKSIENVTKVIDKYPDDMINLEKLADMKGIGEGTINRIKEIQKTGKLSEIKLTSIDENFLRIMDELEETYGIGKKTAYEMFKKHDIKSIEELTDKVQSGEIEVNDIIKKGLKYVGLINNKIQHEIITDIQNKLLDILFKIDVRLFGVVCGSYRREKNYSGDIDLIIVHHDYKKKEQVNIYLKYFEKFLQELKKEKILIESLTGEKVLTKFMGIFKWNDIIGRIDIRFIPMESYYYATLYFTGGKDLNTNMRLIANSRNYKLNEYGLYDENNKRFEVNSEKEIFELLDMHYIQPKLR
jgi:DNA polymerase/3'-5' exonuclease PolX